MFKGNIASQVGSLYKPEDLRRADAFQIFYLGINAGVIASPLIVGTLGEKVGWHYGFGSAGVGMLLAICIYRRNRVGRVAALTLIAVTTVKCFMYDLRSLEGLYRVASLVGLALSLVLVAVAMQKFVLTRQEGRA